MEYIKDFLTLNFSEFDNLGINFPIGAFLVFFTIAMCVASFLYNYKKRCTVSLLKQLIRHNAIDSESAKNLRELHLEGIWSLKHALSGSGQLTYIVKAANVDKIDYETYAAKSKKHGFKDKKINFDEAQFYIPHERMSKAKRIIETSSTEWWRPILISVLLISMLAILSVFLPDILKSINSSVK